jgi:hypothetical protein
VVTLAVGFVPEARLSEAAASAQRARIRAAERALLRELEGSESTVVARYDRLPQLALLVDDDGLARLRRSSLVEAVQANRPEPPTG